MALMQQSPNPKPSASPTERRRRAPLWWLALGASLMIGLIALQALQVGATMGYWQHRQAYVVYHLTELASAVDDYRSATNAYPPDLTTFIAWSRATAKPGEAWWDVRGSGLITDSWSHPVVYARSSSGYTLTSYGADGQPGGVGMDQDLVIDQTHGLQRGSIGDRSLTWQQILTPHQPHDGDGDWTMLIGPLVAALLTFAVVALASRTRSDPIVRWLKLIVTTLVLLGFSACFSALIGLADIVKWH
jgi:hypothetical protein